MRLIELCIVLSILNSMLFGFNVSNLTSVMGNILDRRSDETGIELRNCVFDNCGNLWISWLEWDCVAKNLASEYDVNRYSYWFIQKLNNDGHPLSSPMKLEKHTTDAIAGFGGYPLYPGIAMDCYFFPSGGYVGRIDEKMDKYISSEKFISLPFRKLIFDNQGYMYILNSNRYQINCTKASVQQPLPAFIEEKTLHSESDGFTYDWIISGNLHYVDPQNKATVFVLPNKFLPPSYDKREPWNEVAAIKVYNFTLSNWKVTDTTSFLIGAALYKKIKGSRFATTAIIKGNGDTLLLFIPSRNSNEECLYVCRITTTGEPIHSREITEDTVKTFGDALRTPPNIKFVLRGSVVGSTREPKGILLYGFDGDGSVYVHIWNGSDDYWRMR